LVQELVVSVVGDWVLELQGDTMVWLGLLSKMVVVHHWGLSPWVMVISVQPAVVVAELELVAELAEVVVVLACAAVARWLGVAGGLVAEGLVAEEQKMGMNYNSGPSR
jgi:hypothetical protein